MALMLGSLTFGGFADEAALVTWGDAQDVGAVTLIDAVDAAAVATLGDTTMFDAAEVATNGDDALVDAALVKIFGDLVHGTTEAVALGGAVVLDASLRQWPLEVRLC